MNKIIIIGNLGKDPELSYTPSGVAVCVFPVATTDRWKDKDGNRKEETDWHNIKAFRQAAETLQQYLRKGSKVMIEGKVKSRSWDDKNTGEKKWMTEVIVEGFEFLGETKSKPQETPKPQEAGKEGKADEDLPF